MGSGNRVARIGVIACVLLTGGAEDAAASEIWVAPTYQTDVGGLGIGSNGVWPVTGVGAVRLAWGVPDDLETFTSARLVLIPHAPGGAATLNLFVCAAKGGDMVAAACTGPHAQPFTGVANQLLEVDVSAALAPQVGVAGMTHIAVVAYTTPTTATDHIVGLRFAYDAAAPDGVATLGANTFTGTQTAPAFVGDGSGLTNVPLPAGAATLGANVFTGTQTAPAFVGDGSGLTNMPFPAGAATLGANTFTGTQTIDGANLDLDPSTSTTGNVLKNGTRFLHTAGGDSNLFLGVSAGNLAFSTTSLPVNNTGIGHMALRGNVFAFNNTAVGAEALRDNNSTGLGGVHNTAVGNRAMRHNTVGSQNTALGGDALGANSTGGNNVSIGFATMLVNTTGDRNTALGMNALAVLGDGSGNLGLGYRAGADLTTGSNNIYIDNLGIAVESETIRIGDTQTRTFMAGIRGIAPANSDAVPVVIDSAGQLGTVSPAGIATLSANTFAGTQAIDAGNLDLDPSTLTSGQLTQNGTRLLHTFGTSNTFLGSTAGNLAMTGTGNIGVGRSALRLNESGSHNTAVGVLALESNTSGTFNTAFGREALWSNTTAEANTATGFQALRRNTTGTANTAMGTDALEENVSGNANTALGVVALRANVAGANNTALGTNALDSNDGNNNVAVGVLAGANATTGSNNIYLGANVAGVAGESNTMYLGRVGTHTKTVIAGIRGTGLTGGEMVLVDGSGRLGSMPIPSFASLGANTFTGNQAIQGGDLVLEASTSTSGKLMQDGTPILHTSGTANVSLGRGAGRVTDFGVGNTAIGELALFQNSGDSNTAVGMGAGSSSISGSHNTYIGANVRGVAGESGTMRLGALELTQRTFIAGVYPETTGRDDAVHVLIDSAGQLGIFSSSRRYKEDIQDMGDTSARLLQLRPVTFRYTQPFAAGAKPIQYGLIAEEVAEVMPDVVVTGADGQIETVQYHKLDAMVINELQRLSRLVQTLNDKVATLERRLQDQK